MAKLKYYALCSRNLHITKRHLTKIPKNDLVIILNSLNKQYLLDAESWCIENDIEYYITESDGTPATGKNSVFDIFLKSENDYMVLVDGDDFITPHGLLVYNILAQSENPPDAVALENQYGIVRDPLIDVFIREEMDNLDYDSVKGRGCRVFIEPQDFWQAAIAGQFLQVNNEFTKKCSDAHQKVYKYSYDNLNGAESFLRITFYSKLAARYKMNPNFIVGEDLMHYFDIKYAYSLGELKLKHMDELYPSYVYDQRGPGIHIEHIQSGDQKWLEWHQKLAEGLEKLDKENKFTNVQVPNIKFNWPEDYKPEKYKHD